MKNTKKGFTLIELLVVVLIIGILAAVAIPQYQRAVLKSRLAEYEINLRSIYTASEACKLAKGSACELDELPIDPPACKTLPGTLSCSYAIGENMGGVNVGAVHVQVAAGATASLYYFVASPSFVTGGTYVPGVGFQPSYTTLSSQLYCSSTEQLCAKLGFKKLALSGTGGNPPFYSL